MAELSGMVAILNVAGTAVQEIRDLGPTPVPVKTNRARPFIEVKPALTGEEYHDAYTDQIAATVTRTWTKAAPDHDADDLARLNATLLEEGSVVRAIVAWARDEINEVRAAVIPALPQRTVAQVKTALKAKMRTP